MAQILRGAPAAAALTEEVKEEALRLRERGVVPTLAILRVGEREDDLAYERGAMKRAAAAGISVKNEVLPADADNETFCRVLEGLNEDASVHGILLFLPLPPQLDGERARRLMRAEKDVDGCTDGSLAGVFLNKKLGFPPCTAEAVMELLHYYGIPVSGKKAVVIGRSLVIGRPVSMLLMHENATVTICHTKTPDVAALTRKADIVVAASGQMESVDSGFLAEGQVVIDVGISWNEEKGKLCGDVLFEEAEPLVSAITPVPGGVGAVTTAVLMRHVIEAANGRR
ncbi:MAG: bifunctional 5,10-methylenetetrahydrofolate dehydrogenase/5,10-methenyltetrahydrofolate cyclohydrolase [Lachnospiraceae bacterium]|nr:bifunctional 5,10-methylenetetrahydrofolate dehydrogenase/5,10-methenyltetrahydrofolate cyclohydrolase [Lachnospiraceae bacterium]